MITMEGKINSFEDLVIWQKAMDMATKIYKLVEENNAIRRDFGLKDQFKRTAISISDNIAEGFEYNNNADFYRFLRIAKGSCGEIRNKILFIIKLEFISKEVGQSLFEEIVYLGNQIGSLMKKVKEKMKSTTKKTHNTYP
jgi:four helix bundle protein